MQSQTTGIFKATNVMCMVYVDNGTPDGRFVDLGNYYTAPDNTRCLVTTKAIAQQYGHLVSVPVYVKNVLN